MAKRQTDEERSKFSKRPKVLHDVILADDGALRYDFMTSLEKIAMAKIVTHLWRNQYRKIRTLYRSRLGQFQVAWGVIEKNVEGRVSALPLPGHVTKNIENIVPLIGDSVLKWIEYNDKVIFNKYGWDAVDHISHIVWTARGKIDYAQTARNILSDQSHTFDDNHKYELACTYCLENVIRALAPRLVNQDYVRGLNLYSDTTNKMVYFWTATLTDDIIVEIFLSLLEDGINEIAVKYVWNQLNVEQKTENIVSAVERVLNKDLKFFLLSSIDYGQQQKVFQQLSVYILHQISDDWLWGEYFEPTALHALPVMNSGSFCKIIIDKSLTMRDLSLPYDIIYETSRTIRDLSFNKNTHIYDRYKSFLMQLWVASPWHLKDHMFRNDYWAIELLLAPSCFVRGTDLMASVLKDLIIYCEPIDLQTLQVMDPFKYIAISNKAIEELNENPEGIKHNKYKFILGQLCLARPWYLRDYFYEKFNEKTAFACAVDCLSAGQGMNLITLIFKDLSMQQKINVIYGYLGILHWSYLVQRDMWDSYIEWTQFFKEDILKKVLKDRGGQEAYFYFLRQEVLDDINQFISWAFESEGERVEFKRSFAELYITIVITFYSNVKYSKVESSLNWFANGDLEIIKQFKSEFPNSKSSKCLIRRFIEEEKYAELDVLLDWCFLNNQQEVIKFKSGMYKNESTLVQKLTALLLTKKKMEKFIDWCFRNKREIEEFKKWVSVASSDNS